MFDRFAVMRVVHQLVKVLLRHGVFELLALLRVVVDAWRKVRSREKLDA